MDKEGKVLVFKSKQEIATEKLDKEQTEKEAFKVRRKQEVLQAALSQLAYAKKQLEGGKITSIVILLLEPGLSPDLLYSIDSDNPRTHLIGMLESVKFELFNLSPTPPPKPKGA